MKNLLHVHSRSNTRCLWSGVPKMLCEAEPSENSLKWATQLLQNNSHKLENTRQDSLSVEEDNSAFSISFVDWSSLSASATKKALRTILAFYTFRMWLSWWCQEKVTWVQNLPTLGGDRKQIWVLKVRLWSVVKSSHSLRKNVDNGAKRAISST